MVHADREVTSVDGLPIDYVKWPIGSMLFLLPFHACAATHQHRYAWVVDPDSEVVVDKWRICKGW